MVVLTLFLLFCGLPASGQTLPDWFFPLREAVYKQQLTVDEISPMYRDISNRAAVSLSGASQNIMHSHCEFMMGRAYQCEERKNKVAERYDEGIKWAEKALNAALSAVGWQMLVENISQSCAVRPTTYAMANGLKVEKYSKNALAINGWNAADQIMIAAHCVYAPAPFHNYRRGIEMMTSVLSEGNLEKDNRFNAYLAIGYAYLQQKITRRRGPGCYDLWKCTPPTNMRKPCLQKRD